MDPFLTRIKCCHRILLWDKAKWEVRAEIAQLFKRTLLFQLLVTPNLHLQQMESLTKITSRKPISARTWRSARAAHQGSLVGHPRLLSTFLLLLVETR